MTAEIDLQTASAFWVGRTRALSDALRASEERASALEAALESRVRRGEIELQRSTAYWLGRVEHLKSSRVEHLKSSPADGGSGVEGEAAPPPLAPRPATTKLEALEEAAAAAAAALAADPGNKRLKSAATRAAFEARVARERA